MMNILPHEDNGKFDLLIDTGRGAWIQMSKTSLQQLLERFDAAYPKYTECTREQLVERWRAAETMQRTYASLVASNPVQAREAA
ncbi:hypothetical protein [Rhizobium rhizogenes]|jgi:hypothetical protein|uniref:hypothetical protein n=1 Tax=Rhizobium rhizogenes TaxID=359 RepID=UPI00157448C2|nr:hypothetical protein [Rhizobium rhizogenes]NTI33090.1 hypothetical protein [Rhizobium rhizogenes]WEO64800.1 hypothetical protein G6L54_017400 [Rhizobium rhizogenes]